VYFFGILPSCVKPDDVNCILAPLIGTLRASRVPRFLFPTGAINHTFGG
jgi:hypothetical protein